MFNLKRAGLLSGFVASLLGTFATAKTIAPPPSDQTMSQAINTFAIQFYQQQSGQAENVVFSPASIHLALSMAAAGAQGDTLAQMRKTLAIDPATQNVDAAYAALAKQLMHADPQRDDHNPPAFQLSIANDLWVDRSFAINPAYSATLRTNYGATATPLDFRTQSEVSRVAINQTIAKQTQDKIKDLIPPGAVPSDTNLILTNAVYFKAEWAEQFNAKRTQNKPFFAAGGDPVQVPTMHQKLHTNYFENDELQVLELPYAGHQTSMLFILPKAKEGLAAVEKTLSSANWSTWCDGLQRVEVQIALPKFKFDSSAMLRKRLTALGMTDAFQRGKANFAGISSDGVFIDEVIHKAMIDLDENGTEAAAATAIVMRATAMLPREEEPKKFTADRPFLFALRHPSSGVILFLGKVVNPAAK